MRRKSSWLVAWMSFFSFVARSEEAPRRIAVSEQGITVLVFAAKVNEVTLGSGAYVAQVKEHYLLLKSRRAQAPPTSLFVTYDNNKQFLSGTLVYTPTPPEPYDLREQPKLASLAGPASAASQGQKTPAPAIARGLEALEALDQQYKDLGLRQDKLTLILTHILADQEHYYLQFFLANDSSAAFELEEVTFCSVSSQQERLRLAPIHAPNCPLVLAHRAQSWVYVIERYAFQGQDKLVVDFWEKQGARHLQLNVSAKVLLNCYYDAKP